MTAVVASLVALLAGAFATAVEPSAPISPAAAQSAPGTSAPADPCLLAPPQVCTPPPPTTTTTVPPATSSTPSSAPSSAPCSGEGCIPRPDSTTAPPADSGGGPAAGGEPEDECGITDIGACITEALDAFFRGIVTAALNPLLDLLSHTLLTTPLPEDLPQLATLWNSSWEILLVSYGLLVLIAGIIVMGYQTLQTQHSIKQIAPRLVIGFIAGGLSLWVATKAIQIANALARAVMTGGINTSDPIVVPSDALRDLVIGALSGGLWIIFLGIALAVMLVVLLVSYVVRVALTFGVIAGAPLALMFHALPQTEGIGYWWWRVLGGCLAIQIAQSLTLITMMRLFFAPGGFTMFGPNVDGLVNLLVAIALIYILYRIPGWILGAAHVGGGRRTMLGNLARGLVMYQVFRHFGGGHAHHRPHPAGGGPGNPGGGGGRPPGRGGPGGPPAGGPPVGGPHRGGGRGQGRGNPRGRAVAAHRQRAPAFPGAPRAGTPATTPRPARAHGLGENAPVLGLDGQHQLPPDAQPTTPSPASPTTTGTHNEPAPGDRRKQLDPYRGDRANRAGQYPLPLNDVRRVPRPPSPPPPAPRPTGRRVVQPELPFDPYKGNRAVRGGQYPLPLDGVHRAPKPAPPSIPPPGSTPRAGRQLRLPLDLPRPPKPTPPAISPPPPRRSPKPGGKPS